MKSNVPSPAGATADAAAPSPNGMQKLPWESALYAAVREREAEIEKLRRERAELLLANHRQREALRQARGRLENWKLRQAAWRRERAHLLAELRKKKF